MKITLFMIANYFI